MDKRKFFSSLLFSSLLFVFVAFFLISCEDALSPSEYMPSLDDPTAEGGENEPLEGYWRLKGTIDAPEDWNPAEDPNLFTIMFGATSPEASIPLVTHIDFTGPLFVGPDGCRWSFKAEGHWTPPGDPWHSYFIPYGFWWSEPPGKIRRTWVSGYVLDGEDYVLADEEISKNPENPPGGPSPEWKYDHWTMWWWWDPIYLDLR